MKDLIELLKDAQFTVLAGLTLIVLGLIFWGIAYTVVKPAINPNCDCPEMKVRITVETSR